MSFSDGKHGSKEIAQLSREIDVTGDYIFSIDQICELIETYGKVKYSEGVVRGTNHPWREDMGK